MICFTIGSASARFMLIRLSEQFPLAVVLEVGPRIHDEILGSGEVFLTAGVPVEVVSKRSATTRRCGFHTRTASSDHDLVQYAARRFDRSRRRQRSRAAEKDARPSEQTSKRNCEARRAAAEESSDIAALSCSSPRSIAVYIILGMLYESYAHPFTILSTLPSATFGALLALICDRVPNSPHHRYRLYPGGRHRDEECDHDGRLRARRTAAHGVVGAKAIRQAARLRFRPIVMTTMAALLGALPLALGTGLGSELRQPLGIAIVGGLFLSQFVTLYTTPAVYLLIDALPSHRFGRHERSARLLGPTG